MDKKIRKAAIKDVIAITNMAKKLWPDNDYEELKSEFIDIVNNENGDVFLYLDKNKCVAFLHVAIRNDYVEGSNDSPTGYVEGIFVEQEYRIKGIARALIKMSEDWSKDMGCRQIASDTGILNEASISFHKSVGFREAGRVVCFIKELR